jgi:hypothetical protein
MEPEGSLLCSQQPATGHIVYIQSTNSHPISLKIHSNIIFPNKPTSPNLFYFL